MTEAQPNRITLPTNAEIRRLELSIRKHATAETLGEFRSTFRGHGLTFSDLREYLPGDDIKRIHWKASARTGKTYVKNFEEERQLRIHIAVDFSESLFSGTDRSALSRSIDCASLLSAFGVFNRDTVSLSLFGDGTITHVREGSSRFHLKNLFGALVEQRPLAGKSDLAGHLDSLTQILRKRCVLFIISDFICPPFEKQLRKLSHCHDVCGIEVPTFERLPRQGLVLFEDPESGKRFEVDTSYEPARRAIEERLQRKMLELSTLFSSAGGSFVRFRKSALHTIQDLSRRKRARIR